MRFRHVSDRRVYDFIEMLHDLPCNNPIAPFGSSTEIVEYLRAQWAGLFQRFLTAERRMEEVRVVSEMKSISATLSQMVNYLTAQAKDKDQIIESILSTNHPAFAAFAKVTATPYRVFFQTRTELATWLTARGYGPVKKESWDKGSVAEWLNKGKREYIRMTKDIFDKDGHLVKIIPSSWDDKWITSGKLPEPKPKEPPQPPDDDEIPF